MKTLILLFFIWAMPAHVGLFCQSLTIELKNSTGVDLDSIILENLFIGQLPNDSSILITQFTQFKSSGPRPLMKISALDTSGVRLKSLLTCGTKAVLCTEGMYYFDIVLSNKESDNRLYLYSRLN